MGEMVAAKDPLFFVRFRAYLVRREFYLVSRLRVLLLGSLEGPEREADMLAWELAQIRPPKVLDTVSR